MARWAGRIAGRLAVGGFVGLLGFAAFVLPFDPEELRWSRTTRILLIAIPSVSATLAVAFGGMEFGPRTGRRLRRMAWGAAGGVLVVSVLGRCAGASEDSVAMLIVLALPAGAVAGWNIAGIEADRARPASKPIPRQGPADPGGVGDRDLDGA